MIPVSLEAWAARWGVTPEALDELRWLSAPPQPPPADPRQRSEAHAQSLVRLDAASRGVFLWRNNVGAFVDDTGRVVRYGLANDSQAVNEKLKSSDLIGLRPFVIGPQHVGRVFGQFVAREVKEPGWVYRGDPRERAQQTFIHLVQANGGDAAFTTGAGSL